MKKMDFQSDDANRCIELYKDKKIILFLSGGLDSSGALVVLCHSMARKIQPLFIDRGQTNFQKEREAIESILNCPSISQFQDKIQPLFTISQNIPPKELKDHFKDIAEIDDLYFGRNSDIYNNGARLAHCLNAIERKRGSNDFYDIIASGAIKSLSARDEHKDFIENKEKEFGILAKEGEGFKQVKLKILPPFLVLDKNKEEAYSYVVSLDIRWEEDRHLTWSCWYSGERPCGDCGACKERREAIQRAQTYFP
jgi:7-cyano-7-deazaguanine synthase in queuosine biosynthesis